MATSTTRPAEKPGDPARIAEVIDKNRKVTEEVKGVADELAVVHAVLDKRLPEDARAEDVAQALAHTEALEKRLTESGKVLDQVNAALERVTAQRQERR
jgi:hypothetical protein